MRALDLDYFRAGPRRRLGRYALAVVALVFALDAARYYGTLRDDIASMEERLVKKQSLARDPSQSARLQSASAEEIVFARDTVVRLSLPWDRLFQMLESAKTDEVALLAIEPDAEHRTVTISGEAKDYLAVLSYTASLGAQKALRRVHLVRHEPQRGATQRSVAFTISAAWTEEP
jgi:Fimbrial assembly protein (PilN)